MIDVGANRGMFALTASRLVGENGRVICFEPNPNCLKTFHHEIELNNIDNILLINSHLEPRMKKVTVSVPQYNSGQGTLANGLYVRDVTYQVPTQIRIGDDVLRGKNRLSSKSMWRDLKQAL